MHRPADRLAPGETLRIGRDQLTANPEVVARRALVGPALSEKRLSLSAGGRVRCRFKAPWRDGTTDVVRDPPDFLARLAALVSAPRVNLTRFRGVFAPHSRHRARVTPAARASGAGHSPIAPSAEPAENSGQHAPSGCNPKGIKARRLARVFGIDFRHCTECGGQLRLNSCVEDRRTIDAILAYLERRRTSPGPTDSATRCRAPPSLPAPASPR